MVAKDRKPTLEVTVSITDTEEFQDVLWILLDAYQSTADEMLKAKIEQGLKKILAKKMDVTSLLEAKR